MKTVTFEDGQTLSYSQVADLLEREGRLGRGSYVKIYRGQPLRCLIGAIEDYHADTLEAERYLSSRSWGQLIDDGLNVKHSESFRGNTKARCRYFVQRFRELGERSRR